MDIAMFVPKDQKRKEQIRKAKEQYYTRKKRRELYFEKEEYLRVFKEAERHNSKLGLFLKNCIFGYLDRQYVVPDPEQLNRIEITIRGIGNNINQIARYANSVRTLGIFHAKRLDNLVNQLEDEISCFIKNPPEERK